MQHHVENIISLLEQHRNKDLAVKMSAYMRNQFSFLGIQSPLRKQLLQEYYTIYGKFAIDELEPIVLNLWEQKEREYQYFALDILSHHKKQLMPSHIEFLENLIITYSWWDTVDSIAPNHIGTVFLKYPDLKQEYLYRWNQSQNIWLNRTTLIFQLRYKEKTSFNLMKEMIEPLKNSSEFFIKKAIGWALREYSKTEAQEVFLYVQKACLSNLSQKEALKFISSL